VEKPDSESFKIKQASNEASKHLAKFYIELATGKNKHQDKYGPIYIISHAD
jgi:hypothetical protein